METKVFEAEKRRIWRDIKDEICVAVAVWPFYLFGYNDLPKSLFLPVTVFCVLFTLAVAFFLFKSILDYHTLVKSTQEKLLIKRGPFSWKVNWKKTKGVYLVKKTAWVERGRDKKVLIIDSGGNVYSLNLGNFSVEDEKELLDEVAVRVFENQIPLS